MARMRVLITGGAGFIGSALARALCDEGADVLIVDDLSTGSVANVPPEAALIEGDIADHSVVRRAFESGRPEAVLHLAAQVSNIVSHSDPRLDFRTNVGGTINVLEESVHHRVQRLLYASSMAVYGAPERLPISETSAVAPLSPYGVSKLAAEFLVHNWARRRDLDHTFSATSLRMFNVYGPGQSLTNMYQGVLSVFVANVLSGAPITLYGSGTQTRDFVYIDDVVAAWMLALRSDVAAGLRINIGSGTELSINDLIDEVLASFGLPSSSYPIQRMPELPGDQRAVRAEVALAKAALGWSPHTSFQTGLRATVDWARVSWKSV